MDERSSLILEYLKDPFLQQDLLSFICGDFISSGTFRDVFSYSLDPTLVVKIQRDQGKFNNIIEFNIWCQVRHTKYKKHFAGCPWMSSNGRILLQKRTEPITKNRRAPKEIPKFLTDVKEENYGFIGKNFVVHDYDYTLLRVLDIALTDDMQKWKP